MQPRTLSLIVATAALLALLLFSGWQPFDRGTWWMEVAPVLIVLPVLFYTYGRFPLTTLLYVCIFLHCCILMAGGAYTYARVPLGFDVQQCCTWRAIRTTSSGTSRKASCRASPRVKC